MTDIGDVAGRTIAAGATGFVTAGPLGALVGVATTLVPELVRTLAGETAGQAAQQAATVVQAVAGTDDPVQAAAVFGADPQKALEARVRLAEIVAAAEDRKRQADLEELRVALADVANARGQTVELAKIGSNLAWMPAFQTVAVTSLFTMTLAVLLLNIGGVARLQDGFRDILMALVGALVVEFRGVCQYWVGGSRAGGLAATAAVQRSVAASSAMAAGERSPRSSIFGRGH
jgi:hypothetical protein